MPRKSVLLIVVALALVVGGVLTSSKVRARRRLAPVAADGPAGVRTSRATGAGDVESEDQAGSWADDGGLLPSGTQSVG